MSRVAAICLLLASGCFYTDPINQRPSIDIQQSTSTEPHRGSSISLSAVSSDPENQQVFFQWRAYACTDATAASDGARPGCDTAPFTTGITPDFNFQVPLFRADRTTAVKSVLVLLEGKDELGATARPIQQLIIPLADSAPVVMLMQSSGHGDVVNTPIALYAQVGDSDDDPQVIANTLDWQVFSPPTQPTFELVDLPVTSTDPAHPQRGKLFTPHDFGAFDIQVTATDAFGMQDVEHLAVNVQADHPPCLGLLSPIVPPAGTTYPLSEATLFQVLVVNDDLDMYPPVSGDPYLGTTTFHWFIMPPGATTHQPIQGATSNRFALDPASYTPGDIVELRVEIEDRMNTVPACADGAPTCSVISTSCLQRQTWRVEVR